MTEQRIKEIENAVNTILKSNGYGSMSKQQLGAKLYFIKCMPSIVLGLIGVISDYEEYNYIIDNL